MYSPEQTPNGSFILGRHCITQLGKGSRGGFTLVRFQGAILLKGKNISEVHLSPIFTPNKYREQKPNVLLHSASKLRIMKFYFRVIRIFYGMVPRPIGVTCSTHQLHQTLIRVYMTYDKSLKVSLLKSISEVLSAFTMANFLHTKHTISVAVSRVTLNCFKTHLSLVPESCSFQDVHLID